MNAIPVITTVHPNQAGFRLTFGPSDTHYWHCGKRAYWRNHWQQGTDGIWRSVVVVKCRQCGASNIVREVTHE